MTDAPAPRTRVRRARSLRETLLSIVLLLEAIMLFFAALVVFGLDRLDPDWSALVYGGILMAVLAILAGIQRWTWAVWAGGALQLVIIATGVVETAMFFVGAGFAAMWIYCFVRAGQVEAQKSAWLAANAQAEAEAAASESTSPTSTTSTAPTEGDAS
ncbi:DUF4233 domain-containing protein [Homoserinibacter sp. GY 40078]|uniref:DUF4233 domain-containing protein n=1 Tax=Homoserinibacter sp. GY 40078 TaxID=2603275 RepID=UPI0011C725CC|nr:DUF4233 domain-containing protein [Homoserinibacter sp. GY 40078]TXK19720.1 DUF4233 domain-containing protein [Homoserinibacter sp. GY 40078]